MSSPSSTRDGRAATDQVSMWRLKGRWLQGSEVARDPELLQGCATLFSAHYGRWGARGRHPGEPVRMSPGQIDRLVRDEDAWVALATIDGEIVGYCIAVLTDIPARGRLAWVSQLVVHTTYRNARIGTRLLYSIWQFSNCWAWGLATSSPYAVRALETATRRPCRAKLIAERGHEVLEHMRPHVPYLPAGLVIGEHGRPQPRVDTAFYLDHEHVPGMRTGAARAGRPWALGQLDEGQEWLACTFADQEPNALDDEHLTELLTGSDDIWIQAYEGMTLDDRHLWHTHADDEVDVVLASADAPSRARVLDVGCGDGRHLAALGQRGFTGVGIDISETLIARARARTAGHHGIEFEVADARHELPAGPFDLALSLYDVIGSSARPDDDVALVRLIASRLAPGGHLVASVMNALVTEPRLSDEHRPQDNKEFVMALEDLPASDTMETTGAIFDPELLLLFRGVYYRKEQFQLDKWRLPAELVVRDRRFSPEGIGDVMRRAGLDVLEIRPVLSGRWDAEPPLKAADIDAKELLVIARRPAS